MMTVRFLLLMLLLLLLAVSMMNGIGDRKPLTEMSLPGEINRAKKERDDYETIILYSDSLLGRADGLY